MLMIWQKLAWFCQYLLFRSKPSGLAKCSEFFQFLGFSYNCVSFLAKTGNALLVACYMKYLEQSDSECAGLKFQHAEAMYVKTF